LDSLAPAFGATYYGDILLGGLRLAKADAQRGLIDEELELVRMSSPKFVEDLATHGTPSAPRRRFRGWNRAKRYYK
jgi:hypothetical protein